ncbi:hypothetical protein SteCoe_1110 [Stentor coeruleus]|uniref:Cytochrome b5 heme-binding domain-containing protein n=1 Tax=Stentor coeruleus TaxID=5963 RepID=A0A1R2D2P0_9CILI|nr:hypothetical protein SteCoe_1110 [Stentor coeruleus]
MESQDQFLEFIYGQRYIKLRWNPHITSEEMIIDAIDSLGNIFLEYFNSSFINFVNELGRIVSIDTIVFSKFSLIYIRAPDAKKNMNPCYAEVLHKQIVDIRTYKFDKKQFFVIKNCKLVEENNTETKEILWSEIEIHKKRNDCWIVLNKKVYDITDYIKKHPGGDVILKSAGKDGTLLFNQYHSWVYPDSILKNSYIGIVKK